MLQNLLDALKKKCAGRAEDAGSHDVVRDWAAKNAQRMAAQGREAVPTVAEPLVALREVEAGEQRGKAVTENANSARVRERLAAIKSGKSKYRKAS